MLTLGMLMALSTMSWGCRTVEVETGDRVRKMMPAEVLPPLDPADEYWVVMGSGRFKEFIRKINLGSQ